MVKSRQLPHRSPGTCTIAAHGKCVRRFFCRFISHGKIRESMGASDGKIKEYGAAYNRHVNARSRRKSDAPFRQVTHDTGIRFQSESRAAGKNDGMDFLDRFFRVQQVRFPGPRSAASYIDAGRSAPFRRQDHGNSGESFPVLRCPNGKSRYMNRSIFQDDPPDEKKVAEG